MGSPATFPPVPPSLVAPLAIAESGRRAAVLGTTRVQKCDLGQFWTPWQTASLMADLAGAWGEGTVRVLDPGAGAGALTAAWVERVLSSLTRPKAVHLTFYEIDEKVVPYLAATVGACVSRLEEVGVKVTWETRMTDFVEEVVSRLEGGLFAGPQEKYDLVLMNPPYKKLSSSAMVRRRLSGVGIEATNLYAAFVSLALRVLRDEGRLVAITPRSFCNGPYFRAYRFELLDSMTLTDVHLFDSRAEAFRDDSVLQENVVFAGVKGRRTSQPVRISLYRNPTDSAPTVRVVPAEEIVHASDPERFIHLPVGAITEGSAAAIHGQSARLADLGISVSTGRVVDFRLREEWSDGTGEGVAPLLYAAHFVDGRLTWPKEGFKKPNALRLTTRSKPWLVPNGSYVLVRRFSSKEERRRVVAYLLRPDDLNATMLGIENHLNYYHAEGAPLDLEVAAGLVCYLNSDAVDRYFRSFNGHTQVNATDLRSLRYPPHTSLAAVGRKWIVQGARFDLSGGLGEEFFANGP